MFTRMFHQSATAPGTSTESTEESTPVAETTTTETAEPTGEEEVSGDETPDVPITGDLQDIETTFFNENEVPKELKGTFKKMQASFTKSMQKNALSLRKAEAFDELLLHPGFQAWLKDNDPANQGTTSTKTASKSEGDEGPTDSIETMVERAIDKAFKTREAKVSRETRFDAEFTQFQKDYPDWVNYKADMDPFIRRGFSLPEAYKMVVPQEEIETRAVKKFLEGVKARKASKTQANVSKPGQGTNNREKANPKIDSFDAAFRLAKKQLKME